MRCGAVSPTPHPSKLDDHPMSSIPDLRTHHAVSSERQRERASCKLWAFICAAKCSGLLGCDAVSLRCMFRRFEGTLCLYLQGLSVTPRRLNTKAQRFFATSGHSDVAPHCKDLRPQNQTNSTSTVSTSITMDVVIRCICQERGPETTQLSLSVWPNCNWIHLEHF